MSSHTNRDAYNCPHLGLYRLGQLARSKGHQCEVVDDSLVSIDAEVKKIIPSSYDIVGISVSHNEMEKDLSMVTSLRAKKKGNKPLIIAGGQEATYNGKQWLREGVDLIFTGYAEESFGKALDYFAQLDFGEAKDKIKNLEGVMYLEGDSVIFNPNKPLTLERFVEDNHRLVLDLNIPYKQYWEKAEKETKGFNLSKSVFIPESVRLYTSSSCPHNCGFCNSSNFTAFSQKSKHAPLRLTAKQIHEQILHHINKYGAKCFMFNDDEPLIDKPRIKELCQIIINSKETGEIDKNILFNSQGRVADFLSDGNVDYDFIDRLAKTGFHSIGLGVETFSDRLLLMPSMKKGGFDSGQSLKVVDALLNRGIVPHVFTILFVPEATPEDIKITIKRGMEIFRKGGQIVVNPLLRAMPGARIYDNPAYPFKTSSSENDISKKRIEISKYYIPHNHFLADCAERVMDLVDEEVSEFMGHWKFGSVPKAMAGTLAYVATAKLLKEPELVREGYELIEDKIKELKLKFSH